MPRLTYASAKELNMRAAFSPHVKLCAGEASIVLNYRDRPLITYYQDSSLVVDTHGYMSRSTLAVLNDYLPPGSLITRIPGPLWQVQSGANTAIFYDGIRLCETGGIYIHTESEANMLARQAVAQQYLAEYSEIMKNGELYRQAELPLEYSHMSYRTIMSLYLRKSYPPQLLVQAVQRSSAAALYYEEAQRAAAEQWPAYKEVLRVFWLALRRYIRLCMEVPL